MKWYRRWRARRAHSRLIAQERADWRTVDIKKVKCVVWKDNVSKEEIRVAGYAIFVAQENGVGERRVLAKNLPHPWRKEDFEQYADMVLWAVQAEPRAVPMKEVA